MMFKNRLMPITALAFTALAIASASAGCSAVKDAQNAACCKEFQVGVDMTNADFGVNADIKAQFAAFANAGGDLSVTASAAVADVTTACQNIALDLGADPNDASVQGKAGNDLLAAWCTLASGQISANFGAKGTLGGAISVDFEPPKCSASLTATANCQASCSADAKCDIKANPPTCSGGTLSVECSGSCTAKANVSMACTGSCTGMCSGSCQAAGGVAVDCKGTCSGNCTVDGKAGSASAVQADGSCAGKCDGTCTMSATAPTVKCTGTCDGHCDASCKAQGSVAAKCDGTCDADYTPLKCEGGKLEGGCMVDASCQGSCNASASAKAECTPPSVSVVAMANAKLDAAGQLNYQLAIASLEANLPKILVVLKARALQFTDGLSAAGSAGLTITGKTGSLNAKGVVCGALIVDAISNATGNFTAAGTAAGKVAGAVNIK